MNEREQVDVLVVVCIAAAAVICVGIVLVGHWFL
jgi:hypothetical protein